MKKKILLSILLLALIMPLAITFAGCSKPSEKRVISNFHTAFNAVISANENTEGVDISADVGYTSSDPVVKKLRFVYSSEVGIPSLTPLIENENIYSFIPDFYNRMLDNALAFVYNYTPQVLLSVETIDKKLSDKLYANLDKFEEDLNYVSETLTNLENAILMDGTNPTLGVCLTRLTKLYSSYEKAIESACQLSFAMSDIYFDCILKDYTIDLRQQDFDDNVVRLRASNLVKAKYYYYQLLYTDIFYRVNVKSGDIPTKIRSGEYITVANLSSLSAYSQFDYISTRSLKVKDEANEANMAANIDALKVNINALYNCDALYEKELKTFRNITSELSYYEMKNNPQTLSNIEQAYVHYIDIFLVNVYNVSKNVIENLISIAFA